jgi:phage terminase large subunit
MRIDPKIFNPLYWHVLEALNDDEVFIILITGGSSAAKTYTITQALAVQSMQIQSNTMVLRKEGTSIADSVYSDFKNICGRFNKAFGKPAFEFFVNKVTALPTDTKFRFRGLDDSEKIKGLSDYWYVWMNEVSSFEVSEFSEIRRRLRGKRGQKMICDWNPISEEHWLKTELIDNEDWQEMPLEIPCPKGANSQLDPEYSKKWKTTDGKVVFIKTTYRDNFWITGNPDGVHGFRDENALYNFEQMRKREPFLYNVYGLGEWGQLNAGSPFYKQFKPEKNMKDIPYNPELPIHLSFDFNVNPGMHSTVWQIEGRSCWQIGEIVTKEPKNTTKGVCDEFCRIYHDHKGGLFIYGDPSGRNRDTRTEKGFNDYKIIERELVKYRPLFRIANAHPSVRMRGNFINTIFESNYADIELWVNPKCQKTINDLMYGKEDADGSKLKEKATNPLTKVRYEKFHHCSDSMDYLLTEDFKRDYEKYQGAVKFEKGMVSFVNRRSKFTF